MILWILFSFLLPAGTLWYFTQNPPIAGAVGLACALVLLFSRRSLARKLEGNLFIELQLFLVRCHLLPEDYKVIRRPSLPGLGEKKKQLLNQAYEKFQENLKQLNETRHVLDKFVGTRASHFATQMGKQAVWEGELTRAIVLFSDVRGFTSMTEKLKPQETVRYLNRMFTEFEEVISFSGGEINKFIGDAILAFFPYPQEQPEAPVKKALLAALRLQDSFHQIQGTFEANYSETIHTGLGVGVAAGNVVIGNLGSARRMEFTLIGDTVNTASRLCGIAEDGQILINEELAQAAGDLFRMKALEPVHLKGKTGTHRPYSVLGEKLQSGLA